MEEREEQGQPYASVEQGYDSVSEVGCQVVVVNHNGEPEEQDKSARTFGRREEQLLDYQPRVR